MAAVEGRKSVRKGQKAGALALLFAECFPVDPADVAEVRIEDVFESGEIAWEAMATVLLGSDSPAGLLLFRVGEAPAAAETLAARLADASAGARPLVRHAPAEQWRLELERRRMGTMRCLVDKGRNEALLVERSLAQALEAQGEKGPGGSPAAGDGAEAETLRLDHPALLALPALLLPREWQAGTARAAVSWVGLCADPRPAEDDIRWTAAWSAGPGGARAGFHLDVRPHKGARSEAAEQAIQAVLQAGWKAAWPGLAAAVPGIEAPAFGRAQSKSGKAEVAVLGRLMAGAATLELALLVPAAVLALPGPPGSGPDQVATATMSHIARFLEANDLLLKGGIGAAARGKAGGPGALPSLPSALALFSEADLARLVQSWFLPGLGPLGFQALFFFRPAPAGPAADGAEKPQAAAPALPVLPFDERRMIAALPAASGEEWIEARKAGLPAVSRSREATLLEGEETLKGLWEACRKRRIELGHGGKVVLTEAVGEVIESADRARLRELVDGDLPMSLLGELDKPLARGNQAHRARVRRVVDRFSAKELAIATWGGAAKRPLLEASMSKGKKAEIAAELLILARRLGTGEEGAGEVVKAREELVRRMKELLEDLG